MYRPLQGSDIEAIAARKNSKYPECNVPVREDVTLTNGNVIEGLLSWGHPNCYKIIMHNDRMYSVREWDIGNTSMLGD